MNKPQAAGLTMLLGPIFLVLYGIGYQTLQDTNPWITVATFTLGILLFVGGAEKRIDVPPKDIE